MDIFKRNDLNRIYKPDQNSSGEDNGQVTIIGGSRLFHGAPILSLKTASRMVDMVFFASPDSSVGKIAEKIKSELMSFIWVSWEDVEAYVKKSDAILIGPGLMRFGSEKTPESERSNNDEGRQTREITQRLLAKFPDKKWIIDAGSLQTMDPEWIPRGAIITPNTKEFETLFDVEIQDSRFKIEELRKLVQEEAKKYSCTIVLKGPETIVCFPGKCSLIEGGNAGLTKGGTGDVLAGLTVALFAKNDAHLAACAASYIEKKAADELFEKVGVNYNIDDLAEKIPSTIALLRK